MIYCELIWKFSDFGGNGTGVFDNTKINNRVGFKKKVSSVPTSTGKVLVQDLNGDGKADLICQNYATGSIDVKILDKASSSGPVIDSFTFDQTGFCQLPSQLYLADLYGNGPKDIICREYSTGNINIIWTSPYYKVESFYNETYIKVTGEETITSSTNETIIVNEEKELDQTIAIDLCSTLPAQNTSYSTTARLETPGMASFVNELDYGYESDTGPQMSFDPGSTVTLESADQTILKKQIFDTVLLQLGITSGYQSSITDSSLFGTVEQASFQNTTSESTTCSTQNLTLSPCSCKTVTRTTSMKKWSGTQMVRAKFQSYLSGGQQSSMGLVVSIMRAAPLNCSDAVCQLDPNTSDNVLYQFDSTFEVVSSDIQETEIISDCDFEKQVNYSTHVCNPANDPKFPPYFQPKLRSVTIDLGVQKDKIFEWKSPEALIPDGNEFTFKLIDNGGLYNAEITQKPSDLFFTLQVPIANQKKGFYFLQLELKDKVTLAFSEEALLVVVIEPLVIPEPEIVEEEQVQQSNITDTSNSTSNSTNSNSTNTTEPVIIELPEEEEIEEIPNESEEAADQDQNVDNDKVVEEEKIVVEDSYWETESDEEESDVVEDVYYDWEEEVKENQAAFNDVQLNEEEAAIVQQLAEVPETEHEEEVEIIKEARPKSLKTVSKAAFSDAWKGWLQNEKKDSVQDGEKEVNKNVQEQKKDQQKKEVKIKEDFKANIPDMKRDGRMDCGFSQKLKVPSFIAQNQKEKRRMLQEQKVTGRKLKVISLDEIDVNRDLMNVRFYLKSDIKEKDIKYFITISNWTENSFEIQVNFTQPMIISQGIMRDEMEMTVKNPLLFVSASTGELLDVSSLKFFQTLPTQLPRDSNEKEMKEKAQQSKDGTTAIIIVQILLQNLIQGNMQDMLACVFTLQICCFMTFYQSAIPANAGIYLDQFRDLIEFKLIGPDPILKFINKDWSVAYFRNLKQQRLQNTFESSGITNTDTISNLQVFLFIIAVIVGIFLIPLPFLALRGLRPIMERKYRMQFKGVYYNGIIGGQTVAYLKANIAFGITLKTLDWNQDIQKLAPQLLPLFYMIAYPIICIIVLSMYRDRLDDPDVQAKIKNMYVNIDTKRTRYSIYAYPVWILRRFFFVIIPLALAKYPSLQIMCLCFSDMFYVMYYAGNRPHKSMRQVYLEVGNEVLLVCISYHLFCFTWFILNKDTQYLVGESFLANLICILVWNLGFLAESSYQKNVLEKKKKAKQLAYEQAFRLFHAQYTTDKEMRKHERKYLRMVKMNNIKDTFGSANKNDVDLAFYDKAPKMAEEGLKIVKKEKKKLMKLKKQKSPRKHTHKRTTSTLEQKYPINQIQEESFEDSKIDSRYIWENKEESINVVEMDFEDDPYVTQKIGEIRDLLQKVDNDQTDQDFVHRFLSIIKKQDVLDAQAKIRQDYQHTLLSEEEIRKLSLKASLTTAESSLVNSLIKSPKSLKESPNKQVEIPLIRLQSIKRGQYLHPLMKQKTKQKKNQIVELRVLKSDQQVDKFDERELVHDFQNETPVPMKSKKKRIWTDNKVLPSPIDEADQEDPTVGQMMWLEYELLVDQFLYQYQCDDVMAELKEEEERERREELMRQQQDGEVQEEAVAEEQEEY